jgi:hypothetical protein
MSGTRIGITTTTTDRAHRIDDAEMTTIVVMTIIAARTAATDIGTTTMTDTMMTGMIGTIDEILATIAVTATDIIAITGGITTTAAVMAKETTPHLGITLQRTRREINSHNFQLPSAPKQATWRT